MFRWSWAGILIGCAAWTITAASGLSIPGFWLLVGSLLAMSGASLLLGWGGAVLQAEMSPAVAGGTVAVVASIPTAVSFFFWAGSPSHYDERLPFVAPALLLIGAGWSLAVVLHRFRRRQSAIPFREGSWVELLALLIATLDAFWMVMKRSMSLWDTLILLGAFALYTVFALRLEPAPPTRESQLAEWRSLGFPWFQTALASLMAVSALMMLLAWKDLLKLAEETGYPDRSYWLAAIVDESPVLLTGLLLILQDRARLGIRVLVAALAIQSSLWVGLMPLGPFFARVFSAIQLTPDQTAGLILYATMLFYAVLLLSGLALSLPGALSLAFLFAFAVMVEGTWASWAVAALIACACVVLVLNRRGLRPHRQP